MPLVSGVDAKGLPAYGLLAPVESQDSPGNTVLGTYAPTPAANSLDYSHFAKRLGDIRQEGSDATVRTQYAVQQAAALKAKEEAAQQAALDKQVSDNKISAALKAADSAKAALAKIQASYGSGSHASTGGTVTTTALRQALVAKVASQKGVDYKWGGTSPKTGFDCSGLVQWAYGKLGIKMPRTSGPQAKMGVKWPISKLQPGDLVAHPGHIAVYAGNGMMWEAPHTGAQVRLVPVRSDMYGVHLSLGG